MTDTTPRLQMPLLAPGQAQKEMSHNEALAVLDASVQSAVVAVGAVTPPTTPAPGACWIVGSAATGAWAGRTDDIAMWTAGGWRFVTPSPGFAVWDAATGTMARFADDAWDVGTLAGARLIIAGAEMLAIPSAAIADPTGGATVDSPARAALAAVLAALRHHNLIETA